MQLSSEDVRELMQRILARYLPDGDVIETGEFDYYWKILDTDLANFDRVPEPAVGSFINDFAELQKVRTGEHIATTIDLDRLAAVLTLLSAQIEADRRGR